MSVLLLVEGPDDFHTIAKLIEKNGLGTCSNFRPSDNAAADFVIKPMGGFPRLRQSLKAELASSTFHAFGIVVDADNEPANRWASVTDRLKEIQSPLAFQFDDVPPAPTASGVVLKTNSPLTIGIWLWPDNAAAGDMESFASLLVPANDALWPHAEEAVRTLPETRFIDTHRNKAHIHTWLAWQDPPGQQLGEAIRSGTLPSDAEQARAFLSWLSKLKEVTL